jgi:hypothetical protein
MKRTKKKRARVSYLSTASVYIAMPVWRYLDVRTSHAISAVMSMPRERVYWETFDGDALISRTRSQLATKFIENPELAGADVMVIIDDDVQFQPDDFWKIVDGAREKQAPYGGIYVTRSREPHTAALGHPEQNIKFGEGQEPVSIRYLATGFMAVPRKVLQDIIDHPGFKTVHGTEPLVRCTQGVGSFPMWDFFRCFEIEEGDGRIHYLSEDWAFCERARQCGYEVWADPSIILQHRCVVSTTVADLAIQGHALSADGAPSKGQSILDVGPDEETLGSVQEDMVSVA